MDEKNLENIENDAEITETAAENTEPESEKVEAPAVEELARESEKEIKKQKKIKNQFLLKRGGYSVAITAVVLAGIIIFNILVGVLSKRVELEYDFSKDKKNSLSAENADYVKNVKSNVDIIFCANEDTYSDYMSYYAQQYNVTTNASEYYDQTLKIVSKYSDYNTKINLKYVDPQSADFTKITSEYANETLAYGDIIVSAKSGKTTRHKVLSFKDIYETSEDETYAAYGYTTAEVSGNNIENALTGAISYVLSDKTYKVGFITGHSSNADIAADYKQLLTDNNYVVENIEDNMVTKISSEYDAIVIAAPTTDFLGKEIKALNEYLDNDSKLGKGLVFFGSASAPYLKNLYSFLEDWGIAVEKGVVLETNEQNYMPDEPTTIGSYPASEDEMTADMQICITGKNIPMTASFDKREDMTVTVLTSTPESDIAAPKGSGADFKDADSYEQKSYATSVITDKLDYIDGTKEAHSYVCAFSSTYFLTSDYNESASVSNKNLTLACTERACGSAKSDISFVTKSIVNESFADSVTQGKARIILTIFMILIPIAVLVAGAFVFIKRRNS